MTRLLAACLAVLFVTIGQALAGERTVTLAVENMTCVTCPYIVKQTLAAVPGVVKVEVSYVHRTAIVSFDDAQTDVADLTAATAGSGYPSSLAENSGG